MYSWIFRTAFPRFERLVTEAKVTGLFSFSGLSRPVELVELRQELAIFRDAFIVFFREANHPLLIDDENGALRHPLRPETII
jgi:hypothetical protein